MRRKTFLNNLTGAFNLERTQAEELLKALGLPPDIRGERLSLEDMAKAADYIYTLPKEAEMLTYCPLSSGSKGNCHFAATKRTAVLIDAGGSS